MIDIHYHSTIQTFNSTGAQIFVIAVKGCVFSIGIGESGLCLLFILFSWDDMKALPDSFTVPIVVVLRRKYI